MILNDGIVLKTFLPTAPDSTTSDDGCCCCCCCSIKEISVNDVEEIREDETASTFNVASSIDGDNNVVAADDNDDFGFLVLVVDVGFIVGFFCNIMVAASFERFVEEEPTKAEAANVVFVVLAIVVDNDDNDFLLLLFFINSDIIVRVRFFL